MVEEETFEWGRASAGEGWSEEFGGKSGVVNCGWQVGPGIGRIDGADAPEHPGVMEDKGGGWEEEGPVVVFSGFEIGFLHAQLAGHAEVDTDEEWAGESEKHLFAVAERITEHSPGEAGGQVGEIGATKDTGAGVSASGEDFSAVEGLPAAAVVFDFGEFGHG